MLPPRRTARHQPKKLDEEGTYAKFAYMGHKLDIERHNQQYPPIAANICQHNHDRFLIIDDVVYIFGASLKDAGKKLFAYIKMQETSAAELLKNIAKIPSLLILFYRKWLNFVSQT